jgi:uncharacterized NAD(P)/FAD-binding protein YdhS
VQSHYDIAIIGGGFSGTILACNLARCSQRELSVAILERKGRPGRGVAYGTQCPEHLLNVPAGNMSAFPDDPDHFVEWLRLHIPTLAHSTGFVPRHVFGEYVGEQFDACAGKSLNLQWLQEEAASLREDDSDAVIQLLSGPELTAKHVVLATGNFPPNDPLPMGINERHVYAHYAWSEDALTGIPEAGSILLLGSGLTAIDQVLALHAAGFQGRIYMLSRRGLLPSVHRLCDRWPADWTRALPYTARGLLATVRWDAKQAHNRGSDWRAVIDALRPHSQEIWQSLPCDEQRRFLRHVRPYWEVHRHRYAPQVQCVIDELQAANRLNVIAGRVLECRYEANSAEVRYCMRNTAEEAMLRVDRIVNCTGAEADFRKLQDPLTRSLISHGLARPDPLSLGLDVDNDGAVVSACGKPSKTIFAIGPLRKGCLWETTAVPEIRVQAKTLAQRLSAAF